MKEYIEYFSGLTRSYGVCKVDDGYIDQETGKKKWKHEWTKEPVTTCRNQEIKKSKIKKSRNLEFLDFRMSELYDSRIPRFQESKIPGFQEFRLPGFQDSRKQKSRNSCVSMQAFASMCDLKL